MDARLSLINRTGIPVARSTFYRWVQEGRIITLRTVWKRYIAEAELERVIRDLLNGEGLTRKH